MSFTTVDSVINSLSVNGYMQRLYWEKVPTPTTAYLPSTLWLAPGNPLAGGSPTVGMAGAVTCSSSTSGAISFTNASGGRTMHLIGSTVMSASTSTTINTGTAILVDRLAHANINNNQATANFSPVLDATGRLDSGEGAQLVLEVTSALSAAANTRTFTYTNQAGTGSRVTPTITTVASRGVETVPYNEFLFVPLQSGDKGIRSIESTTLAGGSATGAMNVVLVRPLAVFNVIGVGMLYDKDFLTDLPMLPQIRDNMCLSLYWIPAGAGSIPTLGELRISEN